MQCINDPGHHGKIKIYSVPKYGKAGSIIRERYLIEQFLNLAFALNELIMITSFIYIGALSDIG